MAPKAQAITEKIHKVYFKINNFCSLKHTANRIKKQLKAGRKIVTNHIFDIGLVNNILLSF